MPALTYSSRGISISFFFALTFSLSSSVLTTPPATFSLSFLAFSRRDFFFSSRLFSCVVDSNSAVFSSSLLDFDDFFKNFFLTPTFSSTSSTTSSMDFSPLSMFSSIFLMTSIRIHSKIDLKRFSVRT